MSSEIDIFNSHKHETFNSHNSHGWNLKSHRKCRNFSVKCLQSIKDLKKTCDKLGIKFVGYSKDLFKVDFILCDEVGEYQKFYLVKWQGRTNKYNSWVPASQLIDSEDLLSYYTVLNRPSSMLSEEVILYFINDLTTRKPYDILTITKFYALIYGYDEEYVNNLGLTFSDLTRKIVKVLNNPARLRKISNELFYVMKFFEKRKVVLSKLQEWEIEINANSSVYVKVENNIDLAGPPATYQFINDYISSDVDLTANPVVFCSCVDCGKNPKDCCPHNLNGKFAYNKKQCLQLLGGHPIYECNRLCKCDKNCKNRVVQHGPKIKVAIFRTKNDCGWGLKTLELIQKGQFVLEYLGEIITTERAEEREEVYVHLHRTYIFNMGFDENPFYAVDAMLFGNASHFINHSCDPNLESYSVWINQQDPQLPRIALFAKKKIEPGEELTFDYKMMDVIHRHGELVDDKEPILCKCNSKNCRKYFS